MVRPMVVDELGQTSCSGPRGMGLEFKVGRRLWDGLGGPMALA